MEDSPHLNNFNFTETTDFTGDIVANSKKLNNHIIIIIVIIIVNNLSHSSSLVLVPMENHWAINLINSTNFINSSITVSFS